MNIGDYTIEKVSNTVWEIPTQRGMRVPGRIYGDEETIAEFRKENEAKGAWSAFKQIINVAHLPGILKYSYAMADVHPGYGFPIGGVGAFDLDEGIVCVAGVGFDCNCGVRMIRTQLRYEDITRHQEELADLLYHVIPAGVGSEGSLKLSVKELNKILQKGAGHIVEQGYGTPDDLDFTEDNGCLAFADPATISDQAKARQLKQIGTLGAGNHYLEVQVVDTIFNETVAAAFGVTKGQIVISVHCGSRALGHQTGTDYLRILKTATQKYKIEIPDKELVAAPIRSSEGKQYLAALSCAINCAFANRQMLTHLVRKAFTKLFKVSEHSITTLYDVGHNNAKFEKHIVNGKEKKVLVHRKGATRAWGPGTQGLPLAYHTVGQPVLVGGTMGTSSYVLRGTEQGMQECFGSAIHGAGRRLSRHQAHKEARGKNIIEELKEKGISLRCVSRSGIMEEIPAAYKDIDRVVNIMHDARVNEKIFKLKPVVVIKG
jgi:tRNA-splicing ligase RtcB (3'-phosphate/5'-hydroxy nucleic acid ligase)